MKPAFAIALLLLTSCDSFYRVKRDFEVKTAPSRTCVEDQILSKLNDSFVRFEEGENGLSRWKFTWATEDHIRFQGEVTRRPIANGSQIFEVNSGGAIAPGTTKAVESSVGTQLDNLIAAIQSSCQVRNQSK